MVINDFVMLRNIITRMNFFFRQHTITYDEPKNFLFFFFLYQRIEIIINTLLLLLLLLLLPSCCTGGLEEGQSFLEQVVLRKQRCARVGCCSASSRSLKVELFAKGIHQLIYSSVRHVRLLALRVCECVTPPKRERNSIIISK